MTLAHSVQGSSSISHQNPKNGPASLDEIENALNYLLEDLGKTRRFDATTDNHHTQQLFNLVETLRQSDSERFDLPSFNDLLLSTPLQLKEEAYQSDDPLYRTCLECVASLLENRQRKGTQNSIFSCNPIKAVCTLQEEYDIHHLNVLKEHEKALERVEESLSSLNGIMPELIKHMTDDAKVIDFSEHKDLVDNIHRVWDSLVELNPQRFKPEDCPLPKNLDLKKLTKDDIIRYKVGCENLTMRLHDRAKLHTLQMQTETSLYELIIKINASIVEEGQKLLRHISNRTGG